MTGAHLYVLPDQYRGGAVIAVALLNRKAGTAKTTCAGFLAAALHEAGRRVLLVDADRGMSTLGWSDGAEGFPFRVIGQPVSSIRHQIVTVTEGTNIDAVVIDCPQMEDHAAIVRGAVSYVWEMGGYAVVTVAPSPIEIQRTAAVRPLLDQWGDGKRYVLLNRTNGPKRTKRGMDAEAADVLTDAGFRVFDEQVPYLVSRYNYTFGQWPLPLNKTPFPDIARVIIDGR